MNASARSDINDMICSADRILIVFDNNHGIAQIPEMGEGGQKPVIVPLMQADGGFVKNVHDAYQPGADLACQANTLRLTPGECIGTSFKREVFQPDVHQELKALPHFLQNFFGYLTFSTR